MADKRNAIARIGEEFETATGRWRITDVGSRVIVAVPLAPTVLKNGEAVHLTAEQAAREGWLNGPPYAIAEVVFDEDDIGGMVFR